jgi:hypothetical protein
MSSHGCRTKCDDLTPDVIVLWFVPRIILQSKHNLLLLLYTFCNIAFNGLINV